MNKLLVLSILLWLGVGINHLAFAQVLEKTSKLATHSMTEVERNTTQTLILGKIISLNQFRKITQYSKHKATLNPIDFCVGIMDDEEKALSLEGLNYRQYQNQYAIDQIIFAGKTENFKVLFDSRVLDKNTSTNHIKKLKAKAIVQAEKGSLMDGVSHHKYPYTSLYIIRKGDQDDLIYAYFYANKLIGLQYIMQC